jgi:NADPH-dependent ferric siderophore reductase
MGLVLVAWVGDLMYGTAGRVEWLTPHLVRVLFGGEGLDGLAVEKGWTDA